MTAAQIADNYNQRNGITKLEYDKDAVVWRMMHTGNVTRQSYSDAELIEVGSRLGWGR